MPETILVAKLKATSAITTLIGSRIREGWLNDYDDLPGITYEVVSNETVNGAGGATETRRARITVTAWATTYAGARTLHDAVYASLKSWTSAGTNPAISSCLHDGSNKVPEDVEPGTTKARVEGISADYILWYNANPGD